MNNALRNVLNSKKQYLANAGILVAFVDGRQKGSYAANLDSSNYVGTIVYWPESVFEFQFNSCKSGEVVVLDTKEIQSEKELAAYIEDLVSTKLV